MIFLYVNWKKITTSEYLANYLNQKFFTKQGEKLREDELESVLDKVIQLFTCLSEKDLFLDIYRNQLAKRLLQEKSEDKDAEQKMISKLKIWYKNKINSVMT